MLKHKFFCYHFYILFIRILLNFHSLFSQGNPNPSNVIDSLILSEMTDKNLPGVSTVIVKNGEIVWVESYGYSDIQNLVPVEDSTVFLLASVSKLFTGTVAMMLHENNIIDINENINNYLPWNIEIPGFNSDVITFHQLMTHTSSIKDNWATMSNYYNSPDPTITLGDCMYRYFNTNGIDYNSSNNFLNYSPGTFYNYSNMASALNGYLVELTTSTPFDQYCNDNLFEPLCMDKTSWFFADFDSAEVARPHQFSNGIHVPINHYGFADYPNGQLRSNVMDLANFMITYLNNGNFGTFSLLSRSTIDEMWTPQIPNLNVDQGINWRKEVLFHDNGSSWLWGHNGGESGVSTNLYLDTTNNIGICVLANGSGSGLNICDKLYNYSLTANISSGFSPECNASDVNDMNNGFSIYPNPTDNITTIDIAFENKNLLVELYDLTGSLLQKTNSTTINLQNYPNGIYFVKVAYGNKLKQIKVVKQ